MIEEMDEEGNLKRNFYKPIIKDTVVIPPKGYVIVRFIADNPGFWMIHCHLDTHSDTGMMMILKVGESQDLPPKPKDWPFYPITYQNSNRDCSNKNMLFFTFISFIFAKLFY